MKAALTTAGFAGTTLTLAGAIGLHASWMPWWFTAFLLGMIALRFLQRSARPVRVPALLRLAIMAGLLIAIWINFQPLGSRPVYAGLLSGMLALKLLETESVRDARLVVTFSLFLAMCGFLFDQGPIQSLATAVVVVIAFATLHGLVPGAAGVGDERRVMRALLAALKFCALAIPFAAIVFVAFPRLDAPLWGGPEETRKGRTGMSDRLDPGQLSGIALDDSPAFRVSFDGRVPEPQDRYFRAMVFWSFDGLGWQGNQALHGFEDAPVVRPTGTPVAYEVTMEPTNQRWIALLDAPVAAPSGMTLGGDLQGRAKTPISTALRYDARSVSRYVLQPELPRLQRYRGLQLPIQGNLRARELANSLRARHADDRAFIAAVLGIFNRDFIYSLDPPLLGKDPIDDFLFGSKIGFCEHFASSFTFLMRAARVPARVVVGYQGGYYNATGNYLTVLNSDAHAWSEVWLPGEGWVRVDPTAAVAPERIERGSQVLRGAGGWLQGDWGLAVRDRWDMLGAWWNSAIVEFNALRQRSLFAGLGLPDAGWAELGVVLLLGGIAALALATAIGFRRPRQRRDPVLAAWRTLCERLARAGVPRRPSEGPADFAERAARALPEHAERIRALSSRFVSLRYARSTSEPPEIAEFGRAVRAFRPSRIATKRASRSSYAAVGKR